MATKKKTVVKTINKAAEAAAEEAIDELDHDEMEGLEESVEEINASVSLATDVFEEGFKKALAQRDAVRYHIKKNSQLISHKDYPYSWEKLQEEYGPGYYQVIAKGRTTGKILKMQTEMIGDPNEGREVEESEEIDLKPPSDLAMMSFLSNQQERAEARAREASKNSESSIAALTQAMMTAQQENTKMMITLFQESNKQFQTLLMSMNAHKGDDKYLSLLTTLLTTKKDDGGFTSIKVMEMIQKAEERAENRAIRTQEQIDKKANELADIKADAMSSDDGGNESGLSTLIKGFVPVITQAVMAGQQKPTPEMLAAQKIEHDRRLHGNNMNQNFEDGSVRPMIPAARPELLKRRPNPPPQQRQVPPVVSTVNTAEVKAEPQTPPKASATLEVVSPAKEVMIDDRQKEALFNFCAADIGNAMLNRTPASECVEVVLKKLENEGVARQTVAKAFKLEDFYGYADKYGLPDEAKVWLKEFHEGVQKAVITTSSELIRAADGKSAAVEQPANGANGATKSLATKRSPSTTRPARAQSRQATKNI